MAERDAATEAVRWALGAYLQPAQAQQAAALWQPVAAGASSLAGLSRFCRDVAQRFNLQGREAELHLHIIRALQRQRAGELARSDAVPAQDARNPAPAADVSARTVEAIVLAMQAHTQQVAGDAFNATRWRTAVADQLARARLPGHMVAPARSWLLGSEAGLSGAWPVRGAGTQLVNAAYVVMAEWLGPVQADGALTRIVRELERSGDEALRSARMYL